MSFLSKVPSQPEVNPYLTSLNKKIYDGRLNNRAIGRDTEIEKVSVSLLRRRKPNCILIGDAGAGKTAIVEEIAHRINEQSSPHLQNFEIFELDLNGMIAGTKNRGEFEKRMNEIVEILEDCSNDVEKILFIDEFHNACATDGTEEKNSLITILKPALARGTIRCIGATTRDEYTKHLLPDAAVNRRFTCIDVDELNDEATLKAVLSMKKCFEDHHKCIFSIESVKECIAIANRYFHYRKQPDKSLDLIDEIGSNTAILNKSRLRDPNCKISKREVITFCETYLNLKIDGFTDNFTDNKSRLLSIQKSLSEQIIGQSNAIRKLCNTIMRKECKFYNTKRPIASFLLAGPSASGKTKLSKLFGDLYFGSTLCLDMSEYQDRMSASSLIGAPPGYVAYDEGGILTNFIRRNPYSLILFDEFDKSHPSIMNLLLQILEDGQIKDNKGKKYDFTNSIIIITSNSQSTKNNSIGFFKEQEEKNINSSLKNLYTPEFLNRIDEIVEFNELDYQNLLDIVNKRVRCKLADIVLKYPKLYKDIRILHLDEHVENIFKMTKNQNARELGNNAENYIIDLFVEKVLR